MYSKSWCGFCDKAKQVFLQGGVEVKAYELDKIDGGDAIQNTLKTITG